MAPPMFFPLQGATNLHNHQTSTCNRIAGTAGCHSSARQSRENFSASRPLLGSAQTELACLAAGPHSRSSIRLSGARGVGRMVDRFRPHPGTETRGAYVTVDGSLHPPGSCRRRARGGRAVRTWSTTTLIISGHSIDAVLAVGGPATALSGMVNDDHDIAHNTIRGTHNVCVNTARIAFRSSRRY